MKIVNPLRDLIAHSENLLSEVDHCFQATAWSVGDFSDCIALSALHKLAILVQLNLVEHLKDLVIDSLVLQAHVLEAFAEVDLEVLNADVLGFSFQLVCSIAFTIWSATFSCSTFTFFVLSVFAFFAVAHRLVRVVTISALFS